MAGAISQLVTAAIRGDATAVRRLARQRGPRVAAALADVALRGTTQAVISLAVAALARRKSDPAAIAALQRFLSRAPTRSSRHELGLDWAADALAARREPRAVAAAIASYRALPAGSRARHFLVQTLSNRTERDRALRANRALARWLVEVAKAGDDDSGEAIWGLMQIADPRTTRDLVALLKSTDPYLQQTAALTLIRIGRPQALAAATAFVARCTDAETVATLEAELRRRPRRARR